MRDEEIEIDPETAKEVDVIDTLFTYHAPDAAQRDLYESIRNSGKALARCIHNCCEPGADRSAAIRKVREAVMTANASIATRNAQYR